MIYIVYLLTTVCVISTVYSPPVVVGVMVEGLPAPLHQLGLAAQPGGGALAWRPHSQVRAVHHRYLACRSVSSLFKLSTHHTCIHTLSTHYLPPHLDSAVVAPELGVHAPGHLLQAGRPQPPAGHRVGRPPCSYVLHPGTLCCCHPLTLRSYSLNTQYYA